MERGANTFPFHNLLPYSESNEGLFLFFSPSLNWIKENSVATLAIRNICDKKQNKFSKGQFSHHITSISDHFESGIDILRFTCSIQDFLVRKLFQCGSVNSGVMSICSPVY